MLGLPGWEQAGPDIRFTVGGARTEPLSEHRWYHQYWHRRNGDAWLSCARQPEGYLLREHGAGDFFLSADGAAIVCRPDRRAGPREIREAFLYPILPLALNLRGRDAIHAAAVQVGSGAVAFSGLSGAGKSTLAAYLHRLGYRVLADDYLPLERRPEGIYVRPGLPEIRLWPSSLDALRKLGPLPWTLDESGKAVLTVDADPSFWSASFPLRRLYMMEPRDHNPDGREVILEALPGTRAFIELMEQSHRLDIEDTAMIRRQTDLFAALVNGPGVRALRIGHGFDLLPRAAEVILDDVNQRNT